jgi:drug/metabolite transporter (DMT)-like permease
VHISFAPVFVKLIGMDVLGPTAIGFWRVLLGAGILFLWALLRREPLRLSARTLRLTMLAGALFCGDLFVWHRSILYSGAGMATILGNTQVFATAILSFFIFKEKLTLRYFLAAFTGMIGVILLIGVGSDIEIAGRYLHGVLYGLATGLFYANYIVTLKSVGSLQRSGFLPIMAWTSLFSAIAFLAVIAFEGGRFLPPDLFSWLMLIALALVAQTVGWWLIAQSLSHVDGSRAGLLLLLQPVLATVWGMLFFAEWMTALQIIGAVVTLVAIYLGSLRQRPRPTGIVKK